MNLSRSRRPARLLSKREVWAGLADEEPISLHSMPGEHAPLAGP